MQRLFVSALAAVVVGGAAFGFVGCGSSEQPEAYPGRPIDPPSEKDDLLEMMSGGTATATSDATPTPTAAVAATPTAAPTQAVAGTSTGTARSAARSATATAKPKKSAAPASNP